MNINDFILVLMTRNLSKQVDFYTKILGLELLFNVKSVAGIGKNSRPFLVIKQDDSANSHHLVENKGASIITFKTSGEAGAVRDELESNGVTIRDEVKVTEIKSHYIFIEDFDGNEICLDFEL